MRVHQPTSSILSSHVVFLSPFVPVCAATSHKMRPLWGTALAESSPSSTREGCRRYKSGGQEVTRGPHSPQVNIRRESLSRSDHTQHTETTFLDRHIQVPPVRLRYNSSPILFIRRTSVSWRFAMVARTSASFELIRFVVSPGSFSRS